LVSAKNFFGWGEKVVWVFLPVSWLEEQKQTQAFDRSQISSKSRNYAVAKDPYPYPTNNLQETVLSKYHQSRSLSTSLLTKMT